MPLQSPCRSLGKRGSMKQSKKKRSTNHLTEGVPTLIFNGSRDDRTRATVQFKPRPQTVTSAVGDGMWTLLEKLVVVNNKGSHFGSVGCVLSTAGGTDQQHHTDFHTSLKAYTESVQDRDGTCSFLDGKTPMVKVEGPDRDISEQSVLDWAKRVMPTDADR